MSGMTAEMKKIKKAEQKEAKLRMLHQKRFP